MKYKKAVFYCAMLVAVLIVNGCCRLCVTQADFEMDLKWAYRDLWLAKRGLEYPPDKKNLELCWQSRDQGCINAYMSVQQGKRILLYKKDTDPVRTLSFTLDTICQQCNMDIDHNKGINIESECIGAITALYFFNSENDDKIILDRLVKASPKVLAWVLDGTRAEWYHNRPHPEDWIEFVNKLPDKIIEHMGSLPEKLEKSYITDKFRKKESQIEPFGIMF